MFESASKKDKDKIQNLIIRTSEYGQERCNTQKWRHLKDGIYEMKSGQYRIPFGHHGTVRNLIVITHMFKKQSNKCPSGEITRALRKMEIANQLMPEQGDRG